MYLQNKDKVNELVNKIERIDPEIKELSEFFEELKEKVNDKAFTDTLSPIYINCATETVQLPWPVVLKTIGDTVRFLEKERADMNEELLKL